MGVLGFILVLRGVVYHTCVNISHWVLFLQGNCIGICFFGCFSFYQSDELLNRMEASGLKETYFNTFEQKILTDELLKIFNKTFGNGYMKLQRVALIDEFYGYHLGLIIFAANLKLLKILAFNNKMSLLIYTLSRLYLYASELHLYI